MRTIIVGDVHGCADELLELLGAVDLARGDHLVFCGDLLDKGPDSPRVVRIVRGLVDDGHRVTLVEGNHEARHARFRRHEHRRRTVGVDNPITRGADELRAITDALSDDDVAFLAAAVLYLRLPEHDALVVHAGVPPSVLDLPPLHALADLPRRHRVRYEQLLRVRFVGANGWMVESGRERPEQPFWTATYDGRFGHVYFGHHPFLDAGPRRSTHATGIDLGCVFGNRLCAAVLDDRAEARFLSVPARATYAVSPWS